MTHVCAECGERSEAPGICSRDSQPLVLVDDPLIGMEIGRYRIARAIAAGGMGRVYLGVQPEIGSRVAIKVLSERCADDPGLVERFFAEARAVNLIQHENIVNVLDLATLDDGRPFIVMEHVDGVTLTKATRGGRAPLGGIVHVFLDVLSALASAHAIGIVHRDLKPDNIMITAKGHARVLDFGIAKLSRHQQPFAGARTETGALLGTPAYMAPEQIASAGNVDARSDIYAVGAVLFHAVTGRSPFGGATMFDIMRAQLEEEPPAPRSFRPDLPLVLERVIMRALAKEPAVRFQSATEMAAALDDAAAALPDHQWFDLSRQSSPMRARGTGQLTRPTAMRRDTPPAMSVVDLPVVRPQPARRRAVLAVLALGVLVLVAGTSVFVLARSSTQAPRPDAATVASITPDAAQVAADAPIANNAPIADSAPIADNAIAIPVDASSRRPRPPMPDPAKPALDTQREPIGVVPTRAKPLLLPMDFGPAKKNLTLATTLKRAHSIARMLPGVQTTSLVEIRIGGGSVEGIDATRGGWVSYKLNIDPPLVEGCDVWVRFGAVSTMHVQKGSCTNDSLPLPDCTFARAWEEMLEVRAQHHVPLEYMRYLGTGGYWEAQDSHAVKDDCR